MPRKPRIKLASSEKPEPPVEFPDLPRPKKDSKSLESPAPASESGDTPMISGIIETLGGDLGEMESLNAKIDKTEQRVQQEKDAHHDLLGTAEEELKELLEQKQKLKGKIDDARVTVNLLRRELKAEAMPSVTAPPESKEVPVSVPQAEEIQQPEPVKSESVESESFQQVLALQKQAFSDRREMHSFRNQHGVSLDKLSAEDLDKYKVLKSKFQQSSKIWKGALETLTDEQQEELRGIKKLKEVEAKYAELSSEQIVSEVLKETSVETNKELKALDAEIKKFGDLIKTNEDLRVPAVIIERNEADLKELKARRKALSAKIASMSVGQAKPENDLAGETKIKQETDPQSVLDFERAQAETKTSRREAQQNGINELSQRIDAKTRELGELTAWNTWRKLQIHREIDQLTTERARLQKELNGEQRKIGYGEAFRHLAKKAYRNVKEKIKGDGQGSLARFWGQRAVGLMTFGFWDAHKAEKFRVGTKKTAKEVNQSAEDIQKQGNLSVEDAQAEALEMGDTTGKKSAEIEKLSQEITDRKVKENDAKINEIIVGVITGLEEKLKKYKGDRGENVLTEDAKNKIAIDLQQRLNQMRTAYTDADAKEITKMLRESLDLQEVLREWRSVGELIFEELLGI